MATKSITVRMPEDVLDRVHQAAQEDRRSVNAEIVWLIERALENDSEGRHRS
jgi:hypothetical protein